MKNRNKNQKGFSLLELLLAMTITLVILGLTMTLFAGALGTRTAESRKTDALTSARAALNVISRELANSGFGLDNNGIVFADSNNRRVHFRANIYNTNSCTTERDEDITYFYDEATQSIVRHIRYAANPCEPNPASYLTETSVVVNKISDVNFKYINYTGTNSTGTIVTVPNVNTGRVQISVKVKMDDIQGQPPNQVVEFASDVTLRNSKYMLDQY